MCIMWYALFLEKQLDLIGFLVASVGTGGSCSVESSKGSCLKVSYIHILERSQISVNRFTAKYVWSHISKSDICVLLCSWKNCWILLVSWWQVWLRGLKGVLLSLALWKAPSEDFWNLNNRTPPWSKIVFFFYRRLLSTPYTQKLKSLSLFKPID